MNDPNRRKDRGDPQIDEAGERSLDVGQVARTQRPEDADQAGDEARRLAGDAVWSGSNPGLTGDAEPGSGGTAGAGSGTPGGKPPLPGGRAA